MTSPARRVALGAGAALGGAAAMSSVSAAAGAVYFARRFLTPDPSRPDDVLITAVGDLWVELARNPETVVPGRYGLWLDGGLGHARIGEPVAGHEDGQTIRRQVLGLDTGRLRTGPARWNGYFYGVDPYAALGVPVRDVTFATELGPMPAWRFDPDTGATGEWAVLVHGRGARRHECLRAVKPLLDKGFVVLVPAYRNDEDAPAGPDGRYNLGLSEWRDVESAVSYAASQGATAVVVGGWSMGGAITLQFLSQSPLAALVRAAFLDAPVIDWGDVLRHHARLNHVPSSVGRLARTLMGRRWGRRLVGIHDVLDVARTDWVARAEEIAHPLLLIHSVDDEFVPSGPSERLAMARPDLVTMPRWTGARHTKEWNTDPARWEAQLARFVAGRGVPSDR